MSLTYQKHNCKKLFESFVRDAHLVSLSALKRCLEMGTKPDGDAVGLYHLREFDKLKLLASYGANLNVLFESRRISIFQIDDGDVFILSNKYYVPVDLLGLSLAEVIKKIGPQDIKDYLKKNYNLC